MIIFETIRYKNMLSTGNMFTEIKLNESPTTLIVGDNGAGKSTILDALSFVLFGKAFRKINKPQLINSITQKNLLVEVEFSIGSTSYKICRGMKPNIFEVYINGELVNQSAENRDYQEIIEKQILKVNHRSFCQVVILGSATFQPFMQLPANARREIIEDILDLKIFSIMNVLLKDKILSNTEMMERNKSSKKLVEEKIKLIREHLHEMKKNNEQIVQEKKIKITETDTKLALLKEEVERWDSQIDAIRSEINKNSSIKKKLEKLVKMRHQIEAKLSVLRKDVSFFEDNDNCPTCTQNIPHEFKCQAVELKNVEIDKIDNGLILLQKEYDETYKEVQNLISQENDLNTYMLEQHKSRTNLNALLTYKNQLLEEITNIKESTKNVDDSKIPELTEELKNLTEQYNSLVNDRNIISLVSSMLKDGGIKSKIIKKYIPIINKLINMHLSAMEFMCQFELDENFNETIKSRFRDEFSYSSFSEGEKQKINLAILFAWRSLAKMRNSISTNLLIMDEIFDSSLDGSAVEYVLNIINGNDENTNIFVISHKEQLSDKFRNTIKFTKTKNFSSIVE